MSTCVVEWACLLAVRQSPYSVALVMYGVPLIGAPDLSYGLYLCHYAEPLAQVMKCLDPHVV